MSRFTRFCGMLGLLAAWVSVGCGAAQSAPASSNVSMNPRHINIDNTTDPPAIWLPYEDANKIARIQIRTTTSN